MPGPHYCGLCRLLGLPNERPLSETPAEFRAHTATHDADWDILENAKLVHSAKMLVPGLNGGPGPSGCWCTCHIDTADISRQTCELSSPNVETCRFCGRTGAARYEPYVRPPMEVPA